MYDEIKVSENISYGISKDTEEKISSAVNYQNSEELENIISDIHPADLADYLSMSNAEHREKFLFLSISFIDPEFLVYLGSGMRDYIMNKLGIANSAQLLTNLENADVVYILSNLNTQEQELIISYFPAEKAKDIHDSLSYPDDSIGRIMHKRFVTVMEYWTVGQIREYLVHNKNLPEDFSEIFVINHKHQPVGHISVSQVIRYQDNISIKNVMKTDIHKFNATQKQEEVSYYFRQYSISSAAIINYAGRLIGVTTIDDVVEIVGQTVEEDIMLLGGVADTDIHDSIINACMARIPWLIVNLVMAILASMVINIFSNTIQELVVLAVISPIVTSLCGNCGTQTLTIAVRGLATKEIGPKNFSNAILKEILLGFINGLIIGILGSIIIYFMYGNDVILTGIFFVSVIFSFCVAGGCGSLIPILLSILKFDPAISSSVFVTTVTDVVGNYVLLFLASWLMLGVIYWF